MAKENEKHASLRSEDFEGDPPYRSKEGAVEKRKIASLTLDEFTDGYEAPPNHDHYFDFRSPPDDWLAETKKHSSPHLFKHAYCLASRDMDLREYKGLRDKLEKLGEDPKVPEPIQDAITVWLSKRPTFTLSRTTTDKKKHHWNAWDAETHKSFVSLASRDYGMPAVVLFLVFSIKSMLTSELASPRAKKLDERVVKEWEHWLALEVVDFEAFLASFTHWDAGTTV